MIGLALSVWQGILGSTIAVDLGGAGGPSGDGILAESGDYLLLESGDYLLLE